MKSTDKHTWKNRETKMNREELLKMKSTDKHTWKDRETKMNEEELLK